MYIAQKALFWFYSSKTFSVLKNISKQYFTAQKLNQPNNKNISASEKFQDYSWIQESQPQHTELG